MNKEAQEIAQVLFEAAGWSKGWNETAGAILGKVYELGYRKLPDLRNEEELQKDIGTLLAEYSCNPDDYSLVGTVKEILRLVKNYIAPSRNKPPLLSENPYEKGGYNVDEFTVDALHDIYEGGKQAQREVDIKHYEKTLLSR